MEQKTGIITSTPIPTRKIYKYREISVGTFLGGPLVAGYFIAENFKAFDEHNKAKMTWVYTIIATILIIGVAFSIPDNVKIPNQIIPFIYTAIAACLVYYFQDKKITAHIDAGGKIYSWWRTIAVGLIGLVIILIPIFGYAFLYGAAIWQETTKTYGIMKHEISFDNNNMAAKEVDKIAECFVKIDFFDKETTKYVYAKKVGENYEISISCNKTIKSNPFAISYFNRFY